MSLGDHPLSSFDAVRDGARLVADIRRWSGELGFDSVAIAPIELPGAAEGLADWLSAGCHGELRCRPDALLPGTRRVISLRMNYRVPARDAESVLDDGSLAYVSRYALGRDYHKVLRQRLKRLAQRIEGEFPHHWRVFTDSAPLMEVSLGVAGGLGWRGKHTLLLDRSVGSMFFLGEILTSLPLPVDPPTSGHCGECSACLAACPTGAIVEPYRVDARRCISYLTIELKGSIPVDLRPLIGNRVYGCDDCQIVCPWNKFARDATVDDFTVRHGLDSASLASLAGWTAGMFEERMAGSPIYRIGFTRWLRNLVVALGNGPPSDAALAALQSLASHEEALVREHANWALAQLGIGAAT
ncbi:MAG: tRNA epoxyqueuosine(34) reductase QueG [Rhodocyclaceae bacterium]|nr:tRNA epoxyqueuosine(34) reductase QueG [Rhodocyclaceae bacterium]